MKKILALVACLSLVASLAIGGSIAYLTDRDSAANVFEIGNVDITLNEKYDVSKLLPGMTVEKIASVTNTGDTDAYVWMTIAVPSAFCDVKVPGEEAAQDLLFPTLQLSKGWKLLNSEQPLKAEIDSKQYTLFTVLYEEALASGNTTENAMESVVFDPMVDIAPDGEMYAVKGGQTEKLNWNVNTDKFPIVYVSAYAIQTSGINATENKSAVEVAYEYYTAQWGNNGSEYGDPAEVIDTHEELATALASGATEVILGGNVDVTEAMEISNDVEINLNGYTLDASNTSNLFKVAEGASLTINAQDGEVKFSGSTGVVLEDAELTINGGTFAGGHNFITVNGDEATTITLNNVNFASTGNSWIVYPNSDGDINVNVIGGEYESAAGFAMTSGTISQAKITANSATNMMPAIYGGGDITIDDCEIIAVHTGVSAAFGSTVTVNNSKVTSDNYAFQVMSSGGTINVNNTTYEGGIGTTGKMTGGGIAIINVDGVQKFYKK